MDILEHLGMKVPDIEGHGVIISRANVADRQPTNGSAAQRHGSQSHIFAVRVWSNLCICSPGLVELVKSNLAPDFPLFHAVG